MKLFDYINNLSLKTIILINIFLAILVLIPLTIIISKEKTRTASKATVTIPTPASTEKPPPTLTPIIPYTTPSQPAEITLVDRFFGKVNDAVVIYGKNFGSQKDSITFNGTEALEIKLWQDNKIHVLVPEGATSGLINVRGVNSPYNFIVYDQYVICELLFKTVEEKKILGLKNCPAIEKALFVLKGDTSDFDLVISPVALLTSSSLISKKKQIEDMTLTEIEINLPEKLTNENLVEINIPFGRKINLVSGELWQNNNLVSFFVNPVDLIN